YLSCLGKFTMDRPPAHDFLKACGAAGPLELEVTGPDQSQGHRLTFAQPTLLLGCDENNDVHLKGPSISRCHAFLQGIKGYLHYVDFAHRSGIQEGGPGRISGWLSSGQTLRISDFSVRLLKPPGTEASAPEGQQNPLERSGSHTELVPAWFLELPCGAGRQMV